MTNSHNAFFDMISYVANEGKGRLFKYIAKVTKKKIPGTQASEGDELFTIQIAAIDHPFPDEMFQINDLHAALLGRKQGSIPGFLGWIGGSYTKAKVDKTTGNFLRGHVPSIWVDEVQADVMQRTHEFFEKGHRVKMTRRKLTEPSKEYEDKLKELEDLQIKYRDITTAQSSMSGVLLKSKLEMEQRIADLEDEIDKLVKTVPGRMETFKENPPLGSEFSKFKSKFENYFDRWEDVFYNEAIKFAKSKKCHFMFIIQTKEVVVSAGKEKDNILYQRAYDKKAKELGMKEFRDPDGNYWWWGEVDKLRVFEHKVLPYQKVEEEITPPEQWQKHLETYMRIFLKQNEINLDNYEKGSYEYGEEVKHAFSFWLDEVQEELMSDSAWRSKVEEYMQGKYVVNVTDWWPIADDVEEELPKKEELSDEEYNARMHNWIKDVDLSGYED